MRAPIRWGILGCGDVCEVKSGPGFQKAPNSKLVAVMRRDGAKARDFAQRHSVPKWFDDAAQLVNDPDVDAVYIATPPKQHEPYTLLAAQAGKPVLVEKPMGRNHAECQRMIAACRTANVPLFVAFYRRTLPRLVKIKALIAAGVLGEIRSVNVHLTARMLPLKSGADMSWRFNADLNGAGPFMDLACHTLDFLDYALGPIAEVHGFAERQTKLAPTEDIVAGAFKFKSGALGTGTWCFASHNSDWKDETQIVGSKGKLTFSSFLAKQATTLETASGIEKFEIPDPPHVHQPLIETIVNQLLGEGICPSTGESGARTNWVMDQMLGRKS